MPGVKIDPYRAFLQSKRVFAPACGFEVPDVALNPMMEPFQPFAGIGSEGYVALQEGRRFVGAELKDTYYRQAVANLENAMRESKKETLFDQPEELPA